MGKKKQKKSEREAIPDTGSQKKQPDLYSQIFADTTDSEDDPTSQELRKNTGPRPVASQSRHKLASKLAKKEVKATNSPKKEAPKKLVDTKPKKVDKRLAVAAIPTQSEEDSSGNEGGDYEFDEDDNEDDEDVDMEGGEDEESEGEQEDEEQVDEEEESDSEDESEVSQTALRKQLKDLSYEELETLKQKMGLKEYNEAMFPSKAGKVVHKTKKRRKFERTNKHRPREVSSKARVPKLRQVVKVPKSNVRKDPRFDNSCGEYNEQFWNTEYNFIRDIQKKEAEEMKTKIKSVGEKSKQKEMRRFIQRVTDKEKQIVAKQNEEKKRKQDKEENRKRVEDGKRPFYMKKSTKKLVELVEKYDELKASGGLEKYLKKKRKKNAFRDKKTLTA